MQRDNKGRFSKGSKIVIAVGALVIGAVVFHVNFNTWYRREVSYSAMPVVLAEESMTGKIEALKEDILDRLAKCESGGKKEEDGITILDSNGVGSYGSFQWQRKSVMHYHELHTGQPINGRDAIILAMTPDRARDLARWVIFESGNGVENDWYNCSRKLQLQKEVDVIRKITSV